MFSATSPDAELIAGARRGDMSAFRALVERHEGRVAATAVGMLGAGADAEDVGQEVFLRFYRALDDFRGEAALSTYLTRIAINLSLNALKRRKRLRDRFVSRDRAHADVDSRPVPEPAAEGSDSIERGDAGRALQAALAELPPEQRAVVVLRLVQGYSTRETATLLEIAEGTVTSRLTRARSSLQTLLAPYAEAPR